MLYIQRVWLCSMNLTSKNKASKQSGRRAASEGDNVTEPSEPAAILLLPLSSSGSCAPTHELGTTFHARKITISFIMSLPGPSPSLVAKEMRPYFRGPMPAHDFLSNFSPGGLAAFKDMFLDLANSKSRSSMCGLFVSTLSLRPFCPHGSLHGRKLTRKISVQLFNLSSLTSVFAKPQTMNATTGRSSSVGPGCTVYRKDDQHLTGTDMVTAGFLVTVDFKRPPGKDPFVQQAETWTVQPNVDLGDEPGPQNPFVKDSPSVRRTLGQITKCIAAQMGSQYQTHSFSVVIVKDYARLMRWDRSGVIATGEHIYYNKEPELLEFFKLPDEAAPELRGSDQFVTAPSPVEIEAALERCSGLLGPLNPY